MCECVIDIKQAMPDCEIDMSDTTDSRIVTKDSVVMYNKNALKGPEFLSHYNAGKTYDDILVLFASPSDIALLFEDRCHLLFFICNALTPESSNVRVAIKDHRGSYVDVSAAIQECIVDQGVDTLFSVAKNKFNRDAVQITLKHAHFSITRYPKILCTSLEEAEKSYEKHKPKTIHPAAKQIPNIASGLADKTHKAKFAHIHKEIDAVEAVATREVHNIEHEAKSIAKKAETFVQAAEETFVADSKDLKDMENYVVDDIVI